jgi:hypothetical protein
MVRILLSLPAAPWTRRRRGAFCGSLALQAGRLVQLIVGQR